MAELRRCIGSAKFGIEAHEAPPEDFPTQASQKDGLGRMCKPHWNEYTRGLARDRRANKATTEGPVKRNAQGRKAETAVQGDEQLPHAVAHNLPRLKAAAKRKQAEVEGTCPYTVGKRTCVAGGAGHAGPHEWPKPVKAEQKAALLEELQAILA